MSDKARRRPVKPPSPHDLDADPLIPGAPTPEDCLTLAYDLMDQGRLADAEALLGTTLEGPHEAQCPAILRELRLRLLIDLGRAAEAATLIRPRFESGEASLSETKLLADALETVGDHEGAARALTSALYLDGSDARLMVALGRVQLAAGLEPQAIESFARALRLDPENAAAQFHTGETWTRLDETAKALNAYRSALTLDPDDRLGARLRIADLEGAAPPAKASPAYVRHLFDGYAARYDTHMQETLRYRGPALLAERFAALATPRPKSLDILDLGCGTGLSGAPFASFARSMTGIDLSPAMLAQARATGQYSALESGDAAAWAGSHPQSADLVLACDVLIYLGDLAPIFASARTALRAGGHFIFSTEKAPEGACFELGPTRRFRHGPDYVTAILAESGFQLLCLEEDWMRTERRTPVPALIGIAQAG